MKFGLDVPTTGAYADARVLAQLALEAEVAGWDGFFIWDVLPESQPVIDPWIALTAIALQTSRIKIGLLVAPLARHRPYLVAQRLANLDQLSGGRIICTVGLGASEEMCVAFGEESKPTVRARQLDEGLAILAGLWSEDPFSFNGEHYKLHQVSLHAKPLQTPCIPLWVAGGWPRRAPFRRAAQWDGVSLKSIQVEKNQWLTLDDFRSCLAYVRAHRSRSTPFEVVMSGETPSDRAQGIAIVTPFQEAGATWWVEEGLGWSLEEFRARIHHGPPCR
ncbi:LLM class flavin-dependent oxidoreductase [Dictyobacter kobayashii]|uniref:Luciferase-like protein n=1 Tax=Dictyobacter kobayashii TaxID=2014872 RepID=A0A402ARI7_9CHLR|nr:LLM class flavin-dependent oxidoreductase [Dictyobacter kobayashii]GCE21709.1 luciferase-like protein [Dictyobacter kobayashii]